MRQIPFLQAPDKREVAEVFTIVEAVPDQELQGRIKSDPQRFPVQRGHPLMEKGADLQAFGASSLQERDETVHGIAPVDYVLYKDNTPALH